MTLIATTTEHCASCERLLNLMLMPAPGAPAPRPADVKQSRREVTPERLMARLAAIERVLDVREVTLHQQGD